MEVLKIEHTKSKEQEEVEARRKQLYELCNRIHKSYVMGIHIEQSQECKRKGDESNEHTHADSSSNEGWDFLPEFEIIALEDSEIEGNDGEDDDGEDDDGKNE